MNWIYPSYIFLLISMGALFKTKSLHRPLTVLIFGEIFISFLKGLSINHVDTLLAALMVGIFTFVTATFFDVEYNSPREENVKGSHSWITLIVALVGFVLFYRSGIIVATLIGYGSIYLACLLYLEFKKTPDVKYRKYYYLLKLPYPLLAPLALVEQFDISIYVIPVIVLHYFMTALWLKVELPRMTKPPRIT
ncbi:hypothetical protein [Thermococcus sp. AM4]|uniref:hypothetical protein n=1 Tax=Thermococcus sp. (strain AM4) TaxID=246969 RepID=UPI0001870DD6|nr:hypothetical protein [Thermococcus sp. AM4]